MALDKVLHDFLLSKLNDNTQNIIFKGGYLYDVDDKANLTILTEKELYQVEELDITPFSIISYTGEEQPIPDLKAFKYTLPIQILAEVSQLDLIVDAINTFRDELKGNTFSLVDGVTTSKTVMHTTPLDSTATPLLHNGKELIPLILTVFTNSADKEILTGQDVIFNIKDVKSGAFQPLAHLNLTFGTTKITEDLQNFSELTSKSSVTGGVWSCTISLYLDMKDELEKQLYRESVLGVENNLYELQITFKDIDKNILFSVDKKVLLVTGGVFLELGDFSAITLVFKESF